MPTTVADPGLGSEFPQLAGVLSCGPGAEGSTIHNNATSCRQEADNQESTGQTVPHEKFQILDWNEKC
jgi:hypothetical protein